MKHEAGTTARTVGPSTRRRRRGRLLAGAGIVLAAAVVTAGALGLGGRGGDADDDAAQIRGSQVVEVGRGTLTQQSQIDGQLGHGPEIPFPLKAAGTVTWLPELGRTVHRGETVLRVDDRPVVLLYGSLPAFRELGTTPAATPPVDGSDGDTEDQAGPEGDAGANGAATPDPSPAPTPLQGLDVEQFETNLRALGYTGFTVDETYTDLTANAVKRWQKDLDLPPTGRVGVGDIVYAPGPVRIGSTSGRVGAETAGVSVSHTSTARMVTVNAPVTDLAWAGRGRAVTVDLPDGRAVKGKVASVSKDASAAGPHDEESGGQGEDSSKGQEATVAVVITFDQQGSLGALESGPVTVHYLHKQRTGVLTVPVAALVALAEGGYGMELADASAGDGHFVAVTTGMFADGQVEVSGPGVHQGLQVRIPE